MASKRVKDGPHWVKAWISELSALTDQFRDMDTGAVDFEALGREEYHFRMALSRRDFTNSERARKVWEDAVGNYQQRIKAASKEKVQGDTTDGAANGNNADVSATSPTVDAPATPEDWKSLVSASLSMAGTSNNEAAVTTKNQRQRRAGGSVREAVDPLPPARQRVKLPSSMQDVADFANRENLDYDDARLWWEQNFVERKGKDKDGNRITNWHGALINFCKSQENKRNG